MEHVTVMSDSFKTGRKDKILYSDTGTNRSIVLVTGGSGGLGSGITRALASQGCDVILGYHSNPQAAREISEQVSQPGVGRVACMEMNVHSSSDASRVIAMAEEVYGPLSILVNSAGINVREKLSAVRDESLRSIFEVNVFMLYFMCQAFAQSVISGHRCGRIVNISSIGARYALGDRSVYEASKAAVDRITMSLANELAPFGISVNAVAPGLVETAMTKRMGTSDIRERVMRIPMQRAGKIDEIANLVQYLSLLAPSYLTGTVIPIDGARLT